MLDRCGRSISSNPLPLDRTGQDILREFLHVGPKAKAISYRWPMLYVHLRQDVLSNPVLSPLPRWTGPNGHFSWGPACGAEYSVSNAISYGISGKTSHLTHPHLLDRTKMDIKFGPRSCMSGWIQCPKCNSYIANAIFFLTSQARCRPILSHPIPAMDRTEWTFGLRSCMWGKYSVSNDTCHAGLELIFPSHSSRPIEFELGLFSVPAKYIQIFGYTCGNSQLFASSAESFHHFSLCEKGENVCHAPYPCHASEFWCWHFALFKVRSNADAEVPFDSCLDLVCHPYRTKWTNRQMTNVGCFCMNIIALRICWLLLCKVTLVCVAVESQLIGFLWDQLHQKMPEESSTGAECSLALNYRP